MNHLAESSAVLWATVAPPEDGRRGTSSAVLGCCHEPQWASGLVWASAAVMDDSRVWTLSTSMS